MPTLKQLKWLEEYYRVDLINRYENGETNDQKFDENLMIWKELNNLVWNKRLYMVKTILETALTFEIGVLSGILLLMRYIRQNSNGINET